MSVLNTFFRIISAYGYDAPETALTPEQSRYMKQIYQYYREALLELCTPQQAMEKIQQLYYPTASVE